MFQKLTDKIESFIGINSEFKGDITIPGTLRIDGKLTGKVTAGWIIVGDQASVKGELSATGIVVGGRIEGILRADDIVELKSSARLDGDIFSKKLIVVEGSIFMGKSFAYGDDANLAELSGRETPLIKSHK
jgi:cytoskeletal protein CcmA (bactofilin family)